MPELPEVETTVRDMRRLLMGRTFAGLKFQDWPNLFHTHPPQVFGDLLKEEKVLAVTRRAKYILIELSNDKHLVVHRKMSGNLFWREAAAQPDKYTHIIFGFQDGSELRFCDMRKFGRVYLFLGKDELDQHLSKLGAEPLLEDFTEDKFLALLQGRKGQIKQLLLDQSVLVGLGNIYVDESLWLSKINPLRQAATLTDAEKRRLYTAIQEVLSIAIENRGTTFSDYLDGEGRSGSNQELLRVYQRWQEPCLDCGTLISKTVVGQRGTHFCPHCQPVPEGVTPVVPKQKQPNKTKRKSEALTQ